MSERILIVRLSAIGDVMHGLPVLLALRDARPNAFLAWVVEGVSGQLLHNHPALDQLVRVPRKWLKQPGQVVELRRQLRALEFDVALDLQGLTKSAVAAWLSGAKRRIGYDGRDGRELSRWLNNELVTAEKTHVVDRNLELLAPLGIADAGARFDLPETEDEGRAADKLLAAEQLRERFAVINPGAGWPSKLWPAARFAAVAQYLGTRHALRSLVVWAGGSERLAAEEIVAGSGGSATLAPATSLRELAAVARRATLFVSADTGPLHMAVAVGTPSVGLFGPMPAERNGPYGAANVSVQKMCLTGTSRERRTAGPESMEAIAIEDVCSACDQILARIEPIRRTA